MQSPSANAADVLLAGKEPRRTALASLDGSVTYQELDSAAEAVAAFLLSRGHAKNDRALLIAENSYFWVSAYLGILRAGLVCVPLPLTISTSDLSFIKDSTDAKVAFLGSGFQARNASAFTDCAVIVDSASSKSEISGATTFAAILHEERAPRLPSLTSSPDLAALMYTSGTTSRPRGVMITHGNIIANTNSIVQYLRLTQDDRAMSVLPFHYCFGASVLHSHLLVGGSLVLENRFMYPETVLKRMQEAECTGFAGVPSHFQVLLRRSNFRNMSFPRLRYVQQAGGHLAPAFVRELAAALPKTEVFLMYGQTEATARLAYLPPQFLLSKSGSIGKSIPGVTLNVLTPQGSQVLPGEEGEIVAEGQNIAAGYWKDPVESASCFRDGKLHTGDLATVDDDGFIYLTGRTRDFVKCGGKRISCRQVEEQLTEFQDLLEVAVVGVPDADLGEALKVFAVPRDRQSRDFDEEFRNFCKRRLPFQLQPKEIVRLDSLPKNSSGKVSKQQLKISDQKCSPILAELLVTQQKDGRNDEQ